MKRKVLVIGLDGADWKVINPLLEEGRLPSLASLIAGGVSGNLRSTILPHSPIAWTSLTTGKNPGKHGIFYFTAPQSRSYDLQMLNSTFIRTEAIWQILSNYGKKVGIIDVPITYPPAKVNGYLVSGMPIPSELSTFTFPASLHTELIREFGDFPLEDCVTQPFRSGRYLDAIKELYRFTDHRSNIARYLMKKIDWDFFMVVFRGTDLLQHPAWRYRTDEYRNAHPQESEKFADLITQFYEKIDEIVGKIVNSAQGAHVFIVSDHGFGPLNKNFFMNRWLVREGFMKLKPWHHCMNYTIGKKRLAANAFMKRMWAGPKPLPMGADNWHVTIPILRRRPLHALVDWSKTVAYGTWGGGDEIIKINLKGREPQGCVESGREYETVRDTIIERLYALKDADTEQQVIQRVYKREEIYSGPYVEDAPDLLYETRDWTYHIMADLQGEEILAKSRDSIPALHHPEGILIMNGRHICQEKEIKGSRVIDIVPTIFYLMGLPVPDDCDGKILLDAVTDDFTAVNPVTYCKGGVSSPDEKKETFTQDEQQRIEEHLKTLGYLE